VSAHGSTDTSLAVVGDPTRIVVVDIDGIIDLLANTARTKVRIVELDTILMNLNVGGVEDLILLAKHTVARVQDTTNGHVGLVNRVDGCTITDVDVVGIIGIEPLTSRLISTGCHCCCCF